MGRKAAPAGGPSCAVTFAASHQVAEFAHNRSLEGLGNEGVTLLVEH